mmetsp:Transcript_16277/g.32381  ORF Transcript_16277/g.32381 Transcript_16277/m.32381 type:complete len:336 (-) Transcript_16277:352-1359(-)
MRESSTVSVLINVHDRFVTDYVFSTLSTVALTTNTVDSNCKSLVCLTAKCSKTHCSCTELLHDALDGLNLINWNRFTIGIKIKKITDVTHGTLRQTLLENIVVCSTGGVDSIVFHSFPAFTKSHLVKTNSLVKLFRKIDGVRVVFQFFARFVESVISKLELLVMKVWTHHYHFTCNILVAHAANTTGCSLETFVHDVHAKSNTLKNLSARVRSKETNANFRENLEQSIVHSCAVILLCLLKGGTDKLALLHHALCLVVTMPLPDSFECYVGVHGISAKSNETRILMSRPHRSSLNDNSSIHPESIRNEAVVHCSNSNKGRNVRCGNKSLCISLVR